MRIGAPTHPSFRPPAARHDRRVSLPFPDFVMIRIFIGFDPRETAAWHVLSHSILSRASVPVALVPLALNNLNGLIRRERHPLQSTDFAFSRFLVPHLSGYEGWSLFLDCDMLVRRDVAELWSLRDERAAVMCVKHDHRPAQRTKFLGASQTVYEKKNWSSVMLFNNARCRALTPDYVNTASGLELHQFKWLASESLIGDLPRGWNHLVGWDAHDPHAANVHYTDGGPYFDEYARCGFSSEWFMERASMLRVDQRDPVVAAAAGDRPQPAAGLRQHDGGTALARA